MVAASTLFNNKIWLATPMVSYFHCFTQTSPNHPRHSLAALSVMPVLSRLAMFVITSCREASVIGVRLLARSTGIEPISDGP